jgi:hypothetical protein
VISSLEHNIIKRGQLKKCTCINEKAIEKKVRTVGTRNSDNRFFDLTSHEDRFFIFGNNIKNPFQYGTANARIITYKELGTDLLYHNSVFSGLLKRERSMALLNKIVNFRKVKTSRKHHPFTKRLYLSVVQTWKVVKNRACTSEHSFRSPVKKTDTIRLQQSLHRGEILSLVFLTMQNVSEVNKIITLNSSHEIGNIWRKVGIKLLRKRGVKVTVCCEELIKEWRGWGRCSQWLEVDTCSEKSCFSRISRKGKCDNFD